MSLMQEMELANMVPEKFSVHSMNLDDAGYKELLGNANSS